MDYVRHPNVLKNTSTERLSFSQTTRCTIYAHLVKLTPSRRAKCGIKCVSFTINGNKLEIYYIHLYINKCSTAKNQFVASQMGRLVVRQPMRLVCHVVHTCALSINISICTFIQNNLFN